MPTFQQTGSPEWHKRVSMENIHINLVSTEKRIREWIEGTKDQLKRVDAMQPARSERQTYHNKHFGSSMDAPDGTVRQTWWCTDYNRKWIGEWDGGGHHKVGLFFTPIDMFAWQRGISIWQHKIGLSVTSIELLELQRAISVHRVICTTKSDYHQWSRNNKNGNRYPLAFLLQM